MAAKKSGQRFIKENRAPRVHIEYDVETYGSRQKVEIPFVMGVMSDLSGKSEVEKKPIESRDFLEFDMDNFEERMERIAPRATLNVGNTLTGEGQLAVDMSFRKLDDFSPGEIARNVPALAKLLEAREQLNDLMLYMDGREGAQDLLDRILKDPEMMKSLAAAAPAPADDDGETPAA